MYDVRVIHAEIASSVSYGLFYTLDRARLCARNRCASERIEIRSDDGSVFDRDGNRIGSREAADQQARDAADENWIRR